MLEGSTTIVTGTLGSGKTLLGVEMGMDHLTYGGTLVTNIPLHVEKIAAWMQEEFGLILDAERVIQLNARSIRNFHDLAIRGNQENSVMMVLDEAGFDINAKDHASLEEETRNFVALCRKMTIDLVLISQSSLDVAKQIRCKMQNEIHCRSLNNFWEGVKLPIFLCVRYTLAVGQKPMRRSVKVKWKAQSWGMFDSMALHGERAEIFAALNEAKRGKLKRVEYDPLPYYLAAGSSTLTTITTCLFGS